MIYHHGYQDLDELDTHVRWCVSQLAMVKSEYDSIAVQGMSGVVVGVPTAMRLRKPLLIVRKPQEVCHSDLIKHPVINAKRVGKRVIFLDDFSGGGATRARVERAIEALGAKLVGRCLYAYTQFDWYKEDGSLEAVAR